jgi:hypothetical protein
MWVGEETITHHETAGEKVGEKEVGYSYVIVFVPRPHTGELVRTT